jgi:hypothetical protein
MMSYVGLLSVAVLMLAACTPPPLRPRIERVVSVDQQIFARRHDYYGTDYYGMYSADYYAVSQDGGKHWQEVKEVPAAVRARVELPQIVCESANPRICYRVAQKHQVDESRDGGATWQVAWRVPANRETLVERFLTRGLYTQRFDLGPFDLTLAQSPGTNGASTLIVAMGTDGVLLRTPDGAWKQYTVVNSYPTPFAARSVGDLYWALPVETDLWMSAGWLILVILTMCFSWRIIRKSDQPRRFYSAILPMILITVVMGAGMYYWIWSKLIFVVGPLWGTLALYTGSPMIGIVILGGAVCLLMQRRYRCVGVLAFTEGLLLSAFLVVPDLIISFNFDRIGEGQLFAAVSRYGEITILGVMVAIFLAPPIAGVLQAWYSAARVASEPLQVWVVAAWSAVISMGVAIAGLFPWWLWAYGVIPSYQLALPLAIVLTVIAVLLGAAQMYRVSQASS